MTSFTAASAAASHHHHHHRTLPSSSPPPPLSNFNIAPTAHHSQINIPRQHSLKRPRLDLSTRKIFAVLQSAPSIPTLRHQQRFPAHIFVTSAFKVSSFTRMKASITEQFPEEADQNYADFDSKVLSHQPKILLLDCRMQ
ncbi:hypothetical protein Ddye_027871 [Dipteronia dyeriana]|uniref:Uncharacterized protein n=1 Tax=Dipteronia dyeriana TaxID=168575 RepID=A0AAD9TQ52_9ROSI|nr:hypothetical protein Ddye_027871 [Dipteronia dyeriana]